MSDIVIGNKDSGLAVKEEEGAVRKVVKGDKEGLTELEQLARGQILSYLEQHFKGPDLARVVDGVLRAEGYVTELSPPGPDGDVDIIAGRGTPGLEGPKLCVQVKSSSGVNILKTLQGTMQAFRADQGLLVSWGGFPKSVEDEARQGFLSARLWDANDLVEAVIRNYDRLPAELKNELPLKRIWALAIEK